MIFYHAVTERPMSAGQKIVFDGNSLSGVGRRVREKQALVNEIYAHPEAHPGPFEHHTAVALRELAMEEVRREKYPQYPSRLNCLYVARTFEEAAVWSDFFAKVGRATFSVVKLEVAGRFFIGDAAKCFDGCADRETNLRLAEIYWQNPQDTFEGNEYCEILVDGEITVLETDLKQ